jgi:hypothetical protein
MKGFLQVDGEYLKESGWCFQGGAMTNLVSSSVVLSHWLSRTRGDLCKHQPKLRHVCRFIY